MRLSTVHPTHLLFNAPLLPGGVEVEDERLVAMAVNEERGMVTLLPSEVPPPDRLSWVTVRFADGAVPGRVTFRLAVHSTQGESQVRVYRRARSGESYQQEARQAHERAERCEADLARTRAEAKRPEGLPGLFDAELMSGGTGIAGRNILRDIKQRPGATLQVQGASSYRAEKAEQVAVELEVKNTGNHPWTVEEAGTELVSMQGVRSRVLRVWPLEPIPAGATHRVVVVAEAMVEHAQGSFMLKLVEAGGARTVTLRGVTFP